MSKIRILIADDHAVVRRGLALVLRQEADFEIVAEVANGQEAINRIFDYVPDVALLDWKMAGLDGLQTAQEIKRQMATVRTLILSGAIVDAAVLDMLDNGIDGFVHKDITPAELAHAIRVVARGKPYLGPEVIQALLQRGRQMATRPETAPPPLSTRELEVLQLMATAATYREIANRLTLSETTIHTYVKRILTKLNQPNRTQAVVTAVRLNLIQIE